MKLMLGAILVTLGLFKLRDLIETDYPFGATLTVIIGLLWIGELVKELFRNRK